MGRLRERQSIFAVNTAKLILQAEKWGFEVTLGETYRPTVLAQLNTGLWKMVNKITGKEIRFTKKGVRNSLHGLKLAIDINLFMDDVYLSKTEAHTVLGTYWKSLHPANRWGGDFWRKDGNHYEMTP